MLCAVVYFYFYFSIEILKNKWKLIHFFILNYEREFKCFFRKALKYSQKLYYSEHYLKSLVITM